MSSASDISPNLFSLASNIFFDKGRKKSDVFLPKVTRMVSNLAANIVLSWNVLQESFTLLSPLLSSKFLLRKL